MVFSKGKNSINVPGVAEGGWTNSIRSARIETRLNRIGKLQLEWLSGQIGDRLRGVLKARSAHSVVDIAEREEIRSLVAGDMLNGIDEDLHDKRAKVEHGCK